MKTTRPNLLIIMTDQLREPTAYDTDEVRRFRREKLTAETDLRHSGVTFEHQLCDVCGLHAQPGLDHYGSILLASWRDTDGRPREDRGRR